MERPSTGGGSRRNLRKSDPSDAEAAARAVLAGEASGVPKSADGRVEMIRTLRGPPFRDQGEDAGRQPAAGLARDGTRATAQPFAQALDEGARLCGRTLPPRR